MQVIEARNVEEAYTRGLQLLEEIGEHSDSRAGPVLVAPTPVTTIYEEPTERVLLNQQRDANPFFHLFECIWMMAGASDARWLDVYVRDFSLRFAEDDGHAWGAYGARWRRHFLTDQLLTCARMLRLNPLSRQVVLQMWDPRTDLDVKRADLPCNTAVYCRVLDDRLHITVTNRSNDIIWGAYGANAVHMSVLGELLAGLAGLRLGRYYQMSNNFHLYTETLAQIRQRKVIKVKQSYVQDDIVPLPICPGSSPDEIAEEALAVLLDCEQFLEQRDEAPTLSFRSRWFREVIVPMHMTHRLWSTRRREEAIQYAQNIRASDWRLACQLWMGRRM